MNELYHYGVKGMKWGVRRFQNSNGSVTNAGARHSTKQAKKNPKNLKPVAKQRLKLPLKLALPSQEPHLPRMEPISFMSMFAIKILTYG